MQRIAANEEEKHCIGIGVAQQPKHIHAVVWAAPVNIHTRNAETRISGNGLFDHCQPVLGRCAQIAGGFVRWITSRRK